MAHCKTRQEESNRSSSHFLNGRCTRLANQVIDVKGKSIIQNHMIGGIVLDTTF
jgi:hypothetical protein